MLQPCPLVFFHENCDDHHSFWFLWLSMLSQNEERKLIPPNRYGTDPIVKTATWYILYKSSIDLQNQGRMSVYGMERRKSPLPVAGVCFRKKMNKSLH
mmetsp:Transcript_988/g.1625  ORF Transcript_988/g.1625 Transcript_988/m.1625 type:complete len:98 (+) Transcript_988:211-504(+)